MESSPWNLTRLIPWFVAIWAYHTLFVLASEENAVIWTSMENNFWIEVWFNYLVGISIGCWEQISLRKNWVLYLYCKFLVNASLLMGGCEENQSNRWTRVSNKVHVKLLWRRGLRSITSRKLCISCKKDASFMSWISDITPSPVPCKVKKKPSYEEKISH